MSDVVLARLLSGTDVLLDRFVDISGTPTITSLGTVRDGSTLAINCTGADASGNTTWMIQGDNLIQLPVGSESPTLITTTALDTSGILITQPVSIYFQNSSGVQSNVITTMVLSAANELAFAITQQFLGSAVSRCSSNPDSSIFNEWRFKNAVGASIATLVMNPQGDLNVPAAMTSVDAAIQDGTGLSPYVTQFFADPVSTANVIEVRGLSQAAANSAEIGVGLITQLVGYTQSTLYPLNTVAVQFPSAGFALAIGGTVELTLSLGATGVLAPLLTGVSITVADQNRVSAGLTGSDFRYIDGLNSGLVLNQSINPGTPMQIGDPINLVYSSNLTPNVVGRLIQDGSGILQAANLVVGPTNSASSNQPIGTILAQSPLGDSIVAPGDTVTLTISSGPSGSGSTGYPGVSGPSVSKDVGFGLGAEVGGPTVSAGTGVNGGGGSGPTPPSGNTIWGSIWGDIWGDIWGASAS